MRHFCRGNSRIALTFRAIVTVSSLIKRTIPINPVGAVPRGCPIQIGAATGGLPLQILEFNEFDISFYSATIDCILNPEQY